MLVFNIFSEIRLATLFNLSIARFFECFNLRLK